MRKLDGTESIKNCLCADCKNSRICRYKEQVIRAYFDASTAIPSDLNDIMIVNIECKFADKIIHIPRFVGSLGPWG